MTAEAIRYLQYEANASIIRQVALDVVPGVLQTEEYTRALFDAYRIDADRADKLVESRKERRELFESLQPPETFFILDESVVRRAVGGPKVMANQIEHLVAMSWRDNVSIQVLPFAAGAHPALAGPFIHLEFPNENDSDVIFIENTLGDTLSRDNDIETISTYRVQFWALEDLATPADAFEEFVGTLDRVEPGMH
jgi:hypothetical protein